MEVSNDDDDNLHALWTGPDQEGLKLGMAHYVLGECTDDAGEIDFGKLEGIMSSIYLGDFSKIPGIASYRLGEHEAELIFSPNKEDELFGEKISEMAIAVSREKRWGEVGFTFSVDEDDTGTSGGLDDIQVFSVSTNGHINLEEAPQPMSSVGHTHPNAVPFSGSDIRMIMRYPNIPHMVIIGNNRGYLYLPGKGMSMFELALDDIPQPE